MKPVHVVIQTAFIGDLFLSIPFLNRLKLNNPDHEIVLVCKKGLGEFFLAQKIVHAVFEVKKGDSDSYSHVLINLKKKSVDHIYCLHRSVRSAFFSFRIKARLKLSFSESQSFWDWRKIIFDHLYFYPKSWPEVIRQMSLLSIVDEQMRNIISKKDWASLNFPNHENNFPSIPDEFSFAPNQFTNLSNGIKKVGIFPGSVWATKKWSIEGFSILTQKLIESGFDVYIMGGPDDLKDSEYIYSQNPQAKILTGQMSLSESAHFIQNFDLVICNDSAPAHMAAFFQRPVLALFGPTVLDFGFRPWNNNSQVIQVQNMSCRPCGPHGHRVCPLGHHDCMKKINVKSVFTTARLMLGD